MGGTTKAPRWTWWLAGLGLTTALAITMTLVVATTTAQTADPVPATLEDAAEAVPPQPPTTFPTQSPRNANYTIDVTLDHDARLLTGTQVLTWTNIQDVATDELPFHLYWNGFRNESSTWLRESSLGGRGGGGAVDEADWGWLEVDGARLLLEDGDGPMDGVDLMDAAEYRAPDDGNPDDRTVWTVTLPAPVAPGETVRVALDWRAQVPRTFARTGYRGDYYLMAHWFPHLGVFEGTGGAGGDDGDGSGWNAHQFHAGTEFFSDYGVYDVTLTTAEEFVVGATGRMVEEETEGGVTSRRFVQEDVHTFSWVASPELLDEERTYFEADDDGLPTVRVRLLYHPEHEHQVDRHFRATEATLRLYGQWYGPYPYEQVTVVDPAWGSGTGGMEYPTFFTAGTRRWNPEGGGNPEGVTIHEAGHQFWYGLVGNNEFEHAWMDEGINSYSTAKVYEEEYGPELGVAWYVSPPGTRWRAFVPRLLPELLDGRPSAGRLNSYRRNAMTDIPARESWRYPAGSGGALSYSKTALWLQTLEHYLGWETLREILHTVSMRYRFDHPTPEDFFRIADEVVVARHGDDPELEGGLGWFFDQVHRDSVTFDMAVDTVRSGKVGRRGFYEPTEGSDGEPGPVFFDGDGDGEADTDTEDDGEDDETEESETTDDLYRSEIVVQRRGGGRFPVDLLLEFDDGSETRLRWDGQEPWKLFVHEGPSKLTRAVLDPDRVLLLDLDRTNNSWVAEPQAELAARKWAGKWMLWVQDLLDTYTFFV